jgi:hypothetical protein
MRGPVITYLLRLSEPSLERAFPRFYRPSFEASGWKVGFAVEGVPRDVDLNSMKSYKIVDLIVREGLSAQFSYSFKDSLYSNLGTGLRDIAVVFIADDGQEDVHHPRAPQTKTPLKVINLPPRQLVGQPVQGRFPIYVQDAGRLARCKSVKFRSYLPYGGLFQSTVTEEPLEDGGE